MEIDNEHFVNAVIEALHRDLSDRRSGAINVKALLTIPGIWEILSEHYNNAAIEIIQEKLNELNR